MQYELRLNEISKRQTDTRLGGAGIFS